MGGLAKPEQLEPALAYLESRRIIRRHMDADGNEHIWSLVYGDGGLVGAGTWSPLVTLASAPSGVRFSFAQPFLDRPDLYRCVYSEIYSGEVASQRPYLSRLVPDAPFTGELWTEPVPFDCSAACSLAVSEKVAPRSFDTNTVTV